MKKWIGALMVSVLFMPFLAKAAVPDNVYFFGDGKGYNVDGTQMYYCFSDLSCYSVEGVFAFVREAQVTIANLQNTVTDLQNKVTQLQNVPTPTPTPTVTPTPTSIPTPQPTPQPTSTEIVVGGGLMPSYTEPDLLSKVGMDQVISVDGLQHKTILPIAITPLYSEYQATSVVISLLNSYCKPNSCVVNFQGQTITGQMQLDNLIPYTNYTFDFVYSEPGRQDTTITKTFQTHCGTLCFY